MRHGAKKVTKQIRSKCSEEGCTNIAQIGGVCRRHGAKVKKCSYKDCTNIVQRRGLCKRHGAYKDKDTSNITRRRKPIVSAMQYDMHFYHLILTYCVYSMFQSHIKETRIGHRCTSKSQSKEKRDEEESSRSISPETSTATTGSRSQSGYRRRG